MKKERAPGPWFVYRIRCLIDGREYFGISCRPGKRFDEHRQKGGKSDPGKKLHCAIELHGALSFTFEIVAQYDECVDARVEERRLIQERNTVWPNGFNIYGSGRGSRVRAKQALTKPVDMNYTQTPEFRAACAAGQKARWDGESGEQRRRRLRERWADPEFKATNVAAMHEARVGSKHTPEARKNLSAGQTRRWARERALRDAVPKGSA